MKLGDLMNIQGFELVAKIDFASGEGQVVVMHNNSTHFLVASITDNDGEWKKYKPDHQYRFEGSFDYGTPCARVDDEDQLQFEIKYQYRRALGQALAIVI